MKTSYILTTYQRRDKFERALLNIAEFIDKNDELIVIDGGSVDGTHEIASKYSWLIARFISESDLGPAHALNKGILFSTGDIVVNLNDDDYFYPDAVKSAKEKMKNDEKIEVLICAGEIFEIDASGAEKKIFHQQLTSDATSIRSIDVVIDHLPAGYLFVRRHVYAVIGLYNTQVQANDTEFMSRLIKQNINFQYLNVNIFKLTFFEDSSSRLNWENAVIDRIRIFIDHSRWDRVYEYPYVYVERALNLVSDRSWSENEYAKLYFVKNKILGFYVFRMLYVKVYIGSINILFYFAKKIMNFIKKFSGQS